MFLFLFSTSFWIKAAQLILSLSILVMVHEFGHYFFARLFKVRVEKFYLFFNPNFSLVRLKKINGKWQIKWLAPNVEPSMVLTDTRDEKGNPLYRPMTQAELQALPDDDWRKYPDNTEWGVGWVPFGGYCSMAGMVDETQSAQNLSSEMQEWEFRSKKAWQRFLIIIGGVLVNFITALVIFCGITFHWGTADLPLKNATEGLYFSDLLLQEGFQQQDKIVSIDDQTPTNVADILQWMIIEGKRNVQVLRGEDTILLTMSEKLGNKYLTFQNDFDKKEREKARNDNTYQKKRYVLVSEFFPFVVDSVLTGGVAEQAGLQKADKIIAINDVQTGSYYEVTNQLQAHPCENITITYLRNGDTIVSEKVFLGDQGLLSVFAKNKYEFCKIEPKKYTFFEAIPVGIKQGVDLLKSYVKQFRLVFSKEGAQSLGGFGAIGNMFGAIWDWYSFWYMTAFLSIILAFMNIIPIPALDGGYIFFILIEMITGKKPSDKFLEKANTVGFIILLALVVFANLNDILKIFM